MVIIFFIDLFFREIKEGFEFRLIRLQHNNIFIYLIVCHLLVIKIFINDSQPAFKVKLDAWKAYIQAPK
jgi:hypothetical protein